MPKFISATSMHLWSNGLVHGLFCVCCLSFDWWLRLQDYLFGFYTSRTFEQKRDCWNGWNTWKYYHNWYGINILVLFEFYFLTSTSCSDGASSGALLADVTKRIHWTSFVETGNEGWYICVAFCIFGFEASLVSKTRTIHQITIWILIISEFTNRYIIFQGKILAPRVQRHFHIIVLCIKIGTISETLNWLWISLRIQFWK